MINYLVTARNANTMLGYVKLWGQSLAQRIRVLLYEKLPTSAAASSGTYIFADLELLTPAQLAIAESLWQQLSTGGPGFRLLNRPARWLCRYDLLRHLYTGGQNAFNVHRADELDGLSRYPVFVRIANDHHGGRTPLLHTRQQVDDAVLRAVMMGYDLHQILAVEYVDVRGDDGLYRKYGCFRVGQRLVPRHIFFSEKWIQKYPDLIDPAKLAEEADYVGRNPHEQQLRQLFDVAGVDYGRIDFGFAGGRMQVWETNTNPILLLPANQYKPEHLDHQHWFAAQIAKSLADIDAPETGTPVRYNLTLPPRPQT